MTSLGLNINASKREIWWPSGDARFPEMPAVVQRASPEGTEILKVPVGTDAFIASRLQHGIDKMSGVVDKLHRLEDPHVEFTLLRACLGSATLAYALCGVPPSDEVLTATREADDIESLSNVELAEVL